MRAEISRAQDSILRVTGSRPRFFRAPAGLRNPFLDPVLSRLQLRLASWTRRGFDTVNSNADVVYRRLADSLQDGDILLLHDGNAARSRGGKPVILECCRGCSTLWRRSSCGPSPCALRCKLGK